MKQKELMSQVTEKIVRLLEEGDVAKWTKPWVEFGQPKNVLTGRCYTGSINLFLLQLAMMDSGFRYPAWATYLQINEAGGQIRAGARSTPIVFWKPLDKKDSQKEQSDGSVLSEEADKNEKRKPKFVLQMFQVFNLDQTTLPREEVLSKLGMHLRPMTTDADIEAFVRATEAKVSEQGDRAYYTPVGDEIVLPPKEAFRSAGDYYSTLLHELIHWTGHESRLNRKLSTEFGSPEYAREEIVAELGSLYLCAQLGVAGQLQHKEYLKGWLDILKKDCREIFHLSSQAQAAAEFLLNSSMVTAA